MFMFFFFSSRRRHTRCALVTGVQTCALPISLAHVAPRRPPREEVGVVGVERATDVDEMRPDEVCQEIALFRALPDDSGLALLGMHIHEIGRASCRERVCQYV